MTVPLRLAEGIERGLYSATQLRVHDGRRLRLHLAAGRLALHDSSPTTTTTHFDLASLTKGLATAVCLARLVADGELRWGTPAAALLPTLKRDRHREITVEHLLTHTSGLPWWAPLFERHPDHQPVAAGGGPPPPVWRAATVAMVEAMELEARPGERFCYSDLGYILLGEVIERAATLPLADCLGEWITTPLGVGDALGFRPSVPDAPGWEGCAATERCRWRDRTLQGEVHDENAWAMGGMAGHAGLFGTADAIDAVVERLLACYHGEDDWLPTEIARDLFAVPAEAPPDAWSRGFDRPSPTGSQAGSRLSEVSGRGLLGFTGCSMWLDLASRGRVILLTNRVHGGREERGFQIFRPDLHDRIFALLEHGGDFGDAASTG
jgi:CubicO group peptidase (beta-lactamase class C family)